MAIACLCWLPASGAHAIMEVTFTGTVTDSYVEFPPLGDPFGQGPGSGVLNGLEVTGSFQYDPNLAPPDLDEVPNGVTHQTSDITADQSDAWFTLPQTSIGEMPVPIPSFAASPNRNLARVALADEVFGGTDFVEYARDKFDFEVGVPRVQYLVQVNVNSGTMAEIIDSLLLTNEYQVSLPAPDLSGFGQIVGVQTDPAIPTYDFFADFDLTSLTVAEVAAAPVPTGPAWLLLAALLGTGARIMRRQHR